MVLSTTAILTVIRHGETADNAKRVIQGHINTPLNAVGEAQAAVLARFLAGEGRIDFDDAYSSDLSRALKTAEIIMEQQMSPVDIITDERIRERHLGELQGKRWGDIPIGSDPISTAEPSTAFQARLLSFIDSLFPPLVPLSTTPPAFILSPPTIEPKRILLTSHGGSIRQLIAGLVAERGFRVDLPLTSMPEGTSKRVANCSITEIWVTRTETGYEGIIKKYADDTHFIGSSRVPSPSENVDIID